MKIKFNELNLQYTQEKEQRLRVKKAACKALQELEKGGLGDEFLDPRPIEAGEMYERVEVKHILDFA